MSGSGGSGGARGNARRRRRSLEPRNGQEQSTAAAGGIDAWSEYLAQQRSRQVDADLPGPFVQRISTASPTHAMEQGEPSRPPRQETQVPTEQAAQVPVAGVSTGTFSSLSTPDRGLGTRSGPVVGGQTQTQTLETQLGQLTQMLSNLQAQVTQSHALLERRIVAVETGTAGSNMLQSQLQSGVPAPAGVLRNSTFGVEYRGNGATDFQRLGSPIRRRHDDRRNHDGDRERESERDVFSKSEKWLPAPPEPKAERWTDRESEITGFFSYVQALRAWSQLGSAKMAEEIQQAIAWPDEIVLSTLTEGQKSRSARLFALLKVAFSTHGRVDSLIRAYEAGCPIHNSPAKPFGSCGYELLRILAKEFSLKTRTEALCLRSELLRKEFRVDSKTTHMISDLVRMIQVAINKYNQLIETLPRDVSKLELQVTSADLALLFIRNLPHEAKQYCLLHSEDETWESLQAAGLKFERQQRLYVELGTMSKRFVNEVGEYDGFEEGQGSETVDAVQTGCSRCGKKSHDAKSCTTDLTKVKCFKCGRTGHIGRNCKDGKPGKGDNDGKGKSSGSKGGSKGKPKAAKGSPKAKAKGGKGKMFEVGEGEEAEAEGQGEEAEGGDAPIDSLQMAVLCFQESSEETSCLFDLTDMPSEGFVAGLTDLVDSNERLSGCVGSPMLESCTLSHCGLVHPSMSFEDVSESSFFEGLIWNDVSETPAQAGGMVELNPLLLSTGVSIGASKTSKAHWWLIDSGASVTVLSEETLKTGCFQVLNETELSDVPQFSAANGTKVVMKKKVTIQAYLAMIDEKGRCLEKGLQLSALVGQTSNNILSTTQLVSRGWTVELSKHSQLKHAGTNCIVELENWAGCSWVFLGSTKGESWDPEKPIMSLENGNVLNPLYRGVVVQQEIDEMHRARGHVPFDPNCEVCQKTRSVSQHRRKNDDGGSVIQLSADFFNLRDHKFLIIVERFSGMIGVVYMDPNTDRIRSRLTSWLQEMGCLGNRQGALVITTDSEEAVGSVFTRLGIGKDVQISGAPPQGQQMNGAAERGVRSAKELFLCVVEELRQQNLSVVATGVAVGMVLEYVCFMLNRHCNVHGTVKSAHEFVSGKSETRPVTSAFGSVVLCELPASLQREDRPRFVEGSFMRPEFSSKGCICLVSLDGELKLIRPKSIKLVLPLRWEVALLKGVVEQNSTPVDKKGLENLDGELRLSDAPPTEEPICPKSGPPASWFVQYKLYTEGCSACQALELGVSRKGKVHSRACCANYVQWLKQQRKKASEQADKLRNESALQQPPSDFFEREGIYTPDCPACGALELGLSLGAGVVHSEQCCRNFMRWRDLHSPGKGLQASEGGPIGRSLEVEDLLFGDSFSGAKASSSEGFVRSDEVDFVPFMGSAPSGMKRPLDDGASDGYSPSPAEDHPELIPVKDEEMTDGTNHAHDASPEGFARSGEVSPRGVKRPVVVEETETVGDERKTGSKKRPLEEGDFMDAVNMGCLYQLEDMAGLWTGPDVVCNEGSELQSVVFQKTHFSEDVSFCGASLKVWKPDCAIDDSTQQQLDGESTFSGMKTELGNLDRVRAGTPLRSDEATKLAGKYGVKIIACRWVTNSKVIEGELGVRSRIVVKDVANGPKAKAMGISSPTPAAESIKTAIAIGGFSNAFCWTLDCSAAFMHTPLNPSRKVIVKLPVSVTWPDGSPVYLEASKSLNGLRSASLDWLEFVKRIVKPLNLKATVDPCVFTGPGVVMVIYVDDVLIFSSKPEMGEEVRSRLQEHVPTKLTGMLEPNKMGQVKFVGRMIRREAGSGKLFVNVAPDYLKPCFLEYGLDKLKPGKAAIPNLRGTLDVEPGAKLSPESYARYRRALGKLAWMSQSREDLHVFVTYLSTGQHDPDERYEKAMRQVLRFLKLDGEWELSFPGCMIESFDEKDRAPSLLTVFCDASHAPLRMTQRKGVGGAFIFVLGSLVKGFSRHQTCTSLSSCESELFGIQETAQEAMGLLPVVRRIIYDYFGDFCGYEGKDHPIRILTDSESARQLLSALDVPRRSRHTEVRIYWLREVMERWVSIGWISGEINLSDILTKCSTYHFVHRVSIGFVSLGPAQLAESNVKQLSTNVSSVSMGQTMVILVEVCCSENSALKRLCSEIAYVGVAEDAEDNATYNRVRTQIARAREAVEKCGGRGHVHVHVSCPCTSDSPIRALRGDEEKDDLRFAELEPILKKLPGYKTLSDSFSLEWPLYNLLWRYPGIQELLSHAKLEHEAVVRLCLVGYRSRTLNLPVGKRLKFVSDVPSFCEPLRKFQTCHCATHAPFSDVSWTETGFYNEALGRVILKGVKCAANAHSKHTP